MLIVTEWFILKNMRTSGTGRQDSKREALIRKAGFDRITSLLTAKAQ